MAGKGDDRKQIETQVQFADGVKQSDGGGVIRQTPSDLHRSKFFHKHINIDTQTGSVYHRPYEHDFDGGRGGDEKKDDGVYGGANTMSANHSGNVTGLARELPGIHPELSHGLSDGGPGEPNPRIVFWELKVKRLSDINTNTETFRCRFHFYLTWLATLVEEESWLYFVQKQKKNPTEQIKWVPEWIPRVELTNAVDIAEFREHGRGYELKTAATNASFKKSWDVEDREFMNLLGFDPHFGKWIRCRYECDVTFAEELELETFPFDCQDFTLYFKSEYPAKTCVLLPFPRPASFCSLDPQFSVLSEWSLERLLVEFKTTEVSKSRSKRSYPIIAVHIKAARKWQAHIGNFFLTFAFFLLGLGTFSMGTSNEELGERLGYAITLMLADVASLQLLFESLPAIPYFTELDFYMYSCFLYLFLVTGWSALVGVNGGDLDSKSHDRWNNIDWYARWVALTLLIVANAIFLIRGFIAYDAERNTLNFNDEELKTYYANRRSKVDRRSLICDWDFEVIDQQKFHNTLLFTAAKSKGAQRSGRREILRMDTELQYAHPNQPRKTTSPQPDLDADF